MTDRTTPSAGSRAIAADRARGGRVDHLGERDIDEFGPVGAQPSAQQRPDPDARPRRRRSVTVNLAESPLSWLAARGLVTARQVEAGERLRADYERAAMAPGVTMRWDVARVDAGGWRADADDPTTTQLSAKRRFDGAIGAVGRGLGDVLWRVVCAGEAVPAAERALGWPTRSGRLVLGMALDRLADHYGLR